MTFLTSEAALYDLADTQGRLVQGYLAHKKTPPHCDPPMTLDTGLR